MAAPRTASPPHSSARPTPTASVLFAAGLDLATVLAFVIIGRRNHGETDAVAAVSATAAPFLLGLGLGWIVSRAWTAPSALRTGLAVWAATLVGGMVLRRLLFDDGTAASFIVVAAVFLATGIIGWRVVAGFVAHRS